MWFKKQSRAEKNESYFRKWLNAYIPKSTNQKIELVRVFTDRNDNNWYILKNAGQLTKERSQRIEESMLAIEYGVSKSEIMDKMNEVVPAMTHFVLPGGNTLISYAHICRTVCRRAERRAVAIQELPHLDKIIMFLNRLSDWIFVTSRYLTHQLHLPENLWIWK